MSSESNTERLIDLMYGESTDQEKELFLEEIAESNALQRERAEIRTLLGDISDVWPDQPVSASLHSAIMDAATAATNERAEKKQFVAPVKPPGLWSRLKSSTQIGQIAMVATVVVAGAFVFRFVNLDDNRINEAEMSVSLPEKGDALERTKLANKPKPVLAEESVEDSKVVATKELDKGALDSASEKAPAVEQKVTKKRRAKKRDSVNVAGAKKTNKKSKSKLRYDRSAKSSAPSKVGSIQNSASVDDNLAESEKQSNQGYAQRAEDAEELTLVPAKTIKSVTSKYSARDYSGTIQAADEFVGLKSGTRTERARALQLKAQSLANLGRYTEALRVYDSILKNHKTYQSAAISSSRAEISRKLEERRAPQKKRKKSAPKKSTYDFEAAESQ